jgi:mono/diheme cytochrome c family protein
VADAGGTSNTSFCSNSVCHGTEWKFAGFNAPKLRAALAGQAQAMITPTPTPTATPKPTSASAAGWNGVPTGTPSASGQTGNVTYVQIGAIFTQECSACHGASGAMKNLTLVTYAGVMAGSTDGAVIIPGNPAASLLIKVQTAGQPHFGQLTSDELAQVIFWIQAGAPEK